MVTTRIPQTPYIISNCLSMDKNQFLAHCKPKKPAHFVQPRQSPVNVEKQSIDFYIRQGWLSRECKIVVRLLPQESLEFTCTCMVPSEKLCDHESEVLRLIAVTGDITNFVLQFETDYLEKFKKRTLIEYGLSPKTNFDEYFKADNSTGLWRAIPFDKGLGLQRPKQFRSEQEATAFNQFKKFEIPDSLHLPMGNTSLQLESQEDRIMGYAILFGEKFQYASKAGTKLIPICGKPDKSGEVIGSNIREFSRIYSSGTLYIHFTDDDKALLDHSMSMTERNAQLYADVAGEKYQDRESQDNALHKYFLNQLKQIVPLLEKQQSVYKIASYLRASNKEVKKSDLEEIKLSAEPVNLTFQLTENDDLIELSAFISIGDEEEPLQRVTVNDGNPFLFTLFQGVYHLNRSVAESNALSVFKSNPVLKMSKNEFDNFFEEVVKPVAQNYPLTINKIKGIRTKSVKLKPAERRIYISELGKFIVFKPFVQYTPLGLTADEESDGMLVNPLHSTNPIEKNNKIITTFKRNAAYEREFLDYMKSLHPHFASQESGDFYYMPIEDMMRENWFFNAFENMIGADVNVFGYKDLKSFRYSPYKANVSVQLKSGEDWFDVHVTVGFGDMEVSLKDVQKAIIRNEKYVKLADGTTGILPEEWFEKLSKYFEQGNIKEEKIQISKLRFTIIDELFDNIDDKEIVRELLDKKQRILSFKEIKDVEIPAGINATLRDYQKEGLNWLNFLHEFKWGGILADDMGLGKTLQTLTFLVHLPKGASPHLVVAPTSLMFNWENEIRKFSPLTRAHFYLGGDRSKDLSSFDDFDIVFTTYGLMTRDIEDLSKYKFNYIILDESQAIKNPHSQRYKAACLLKGKNRIALSGTPIENNTFDLFAQMTFLNPGFLGNAHQFKERFSNPIDRDRNDEVAKKLQKLISPFIIRRTKEQVEKDLPEKTEDILYCEMGTEQQKVYDAFRNRYRNYLIDKIEEEGIGKSKIYVLEGLTKLRQICDSPEILSEEEVYTTESIKIKELVRNIREKTGRHKILVFSQFVKMLQLIKKELEEDAIIHEYFDGASSIDQRQAAVNNFQTNEECRVFLISLKAGGVGINLTAADYVYLVDPWWNPAAENQAIDRCHRIGQTKKVIAYRMICKNTVEEKIMNLQARKMKLASDIIQTEESFMKNITRDDIVALFD